MNFNILETGTQWHKNLRSEGIESFPYARASLEDSSLLGCHATLISEQLHIYHPLYCQSIISQNIWIFINTALRNSNLTKGTNSHKFMIDSGRPRETSAQILLQVHKVSSYKRADNHVRMTCGKEGQQKLVVWASKAKDDDNRKINMHWWIKNGTKVTIKQLSNINKSYTWTS